MWRAVFLGIVAACSKSSNDKPAPATRDAKVLDAPVPEVLLPLPWIKEDLDPQIHAQAGDALVAKSAGRCNSASPKAIYTAVVSRDGAHLIGIDCGERDSHVIGLVRHDGKTATVLAAAQVATGSVRVDGILASETRLCMQYNQVDKFRITKNLRHCFPIAGDTKQPTIAPPPDPTAALPMWAAPEDAMSAAKVQVYEEIQTCQDATERPPETTYAVTHGDRKWIAVSCGNLSRPSNGLALFEIRAGRPIVLAYSLDADTRTIEMERIRANDKLACMDYKQLPSGDHTELCTALY
jgi:hypothetical protein